VVIFFSGSGDFNMKHRIPVADAPFEIVWDDTGVPHVFASTQADAYRGMGYAAGFERLWQIHLSTCYANGEAAALLGERFVQQDALLRACNVPGRLTGLPPSRGDWVVSAYLDGLNAYIDTLTEVPAEFAQAQVEPRYFTAADVAARYRFTSWFQHKSWTEKLVIGQLMARHGVDYFRNNVLHFSPQDEQLIALLADPLQRIDMKMIQLVYPDAGMMDLSGSNNWAVSAGRSLSGGPLLATDPHQPHLIPNTFFYVHLHVDDWEVFGAAFPGVPYFMMGYTADVAWGLTTGCVDSYDVYVEKMSGDNSYYGDTWVPLQHRIENIEIRNADTRSITVSETGNGVLLEPLLGELGMTEAIDSTFQTSLRWSLAKVPSSAGALALLPMAKSSEQFGELLFENDVCPLVNNIICVDGESNLHRFIAATLPVRRGVTGSVPLPGWDKNYQFPLAAAADLVVERNPEAQFLLTANNDTMEDSGDFFIHNFPAHSARADRIRALLNTKRKFSVEDFCEMQLDLDDTRAVAVLEQLLPVLEQSLDEDVQLACRALHDWDCRATANSSGACFFYPFMDQFWPRDFMFEVLNDPLVKKLPLAAPGFNRLDINHFMAAQSPWLDHHETLARIISEKMKQVVLGLRNTLGHDHRKWRWGDLHQIEFSHRLLKHPQWSHLHVGPDPIGGSPFTLAMAVHAGQGQAGIDGDLSCRVYHGPAYRLVVDLADHQHARFVIAGGNSGRPDSPFTTNQYQSWLKGDYYTLFLDREEIAEFETWQVVR